MSLESSLRSRSKIVTVFTIGALLIGSAMAVADGLSTNSGTFTAAQAERGRQVYERSCQNCHKEDFYRERLMRWQNKPVSQLFEAVSATMPADNVGALATSEYIDVLAYVFSITGSPAGDTELSTDNMENIQIVQK